MREKSAAAKPVLACAARTVSSSRSSVLIISAARSAFNCSISALSWPRSRKTFPLPRTTSRFSPFIGVPLQSLESILRQVYLVFRCLGALFRFLLKCMNDPDFIRQLNPCKRRENASPRNASAIPNTPEPKPCMGFAMSALPPSAAMVSAVRKVDFASLGKASKSFNAASIHETGRVLRASAILFGASTMLSYITTEGQGFDWI
jgi:hypothetical protein